MSASIRDMIVSAKAWGCAATVNTLHHKFKAWPNGHVRVDGVHLTIERAQEKLDEARIADRASRAGLV